MVSPLKCALLSGCAYLCLALPALAQTEGPVNDAGAARQNPASVGIGAQQLETIVVTANKREEKLQDVGQTISALSADALADRRIESLQDIAAAIPGLSFSSSTTNTPVYTLRGVGFNESSLGVYPAVSVYLDQIPLPFPVLASHSAYDLERIEVLKGPQGTLFGQNSTGGAINYIAAPPSDNFKAGGDLTYGRFNDVEGNAFINGQIAPNLDARLSMTGADQDGWQHSYTRSDTNGSVGYFASRLALKWEPLDTLRVNFNVNGWTDQSQPQAQQVIAVDPSKPAYAYLKQPLVSYPLAPLDAQSADWSTGAFAPKADRKFIQAGARIDYDLTQNVTLTSLTSYDYYDQRQTTDGDGLTLNIFDLGTNDGSIHSFNQELRIANSGESSLRWVAGGSYENSRTFENQILSFGDGANSNPSNFFIATSGVTNLQNIENYAAFGNVEYDILPNLAVKGGVRFTDSMDHDTICGYSPGPDNGNIPLFEYLGQALGGKSVQLASSSCYTLNNQNVPGEPFDSSLHQTNVSWRGGFDYKLDKDTLAYFNVSRGFKAGSYPSLAAATYAQLQPVVQEQLQAYEAGIKSQLLDHKLQIDGSVFYYDYTNKQVRGKLNDPVFGPLDSLVNVPKSQVLGAEADATIKPLAGLTVTAAATYLESTVNKYTGYDVLGQVQDFKGVSLPDSPKWSVGLDADYRWELPNGGVPFFGLTVDARTQTDGVLGGSRTTLPASALNRIDSGVSNLYKIDGYSTVDARLGYEMDNGKWKVMLWGKNIFNSYYWNNVVVTSDSVSRLTGMPATYGITLTWRYN